MKVRISVTVSEDLPEQLERLLGPVAHRSAVLEQALREFMANRGRRRGDAADLGILNALAEELNEEARDVLGYQVEP